MEEEELLAPDLILLLMVAPSRWPQAENRINGITRLEKLLFLIEKEHGEHIGLEEPFQFESYHYGPYSRAVYEAVELLEEANLLEEYRQLTDSNLDRAEELLYSDTATELSYERQFALTSDGETVASYLASIHSQVYERISKLKDQYGGLTLQNLIYHVYTQYPDYTEKSVIRDQVLGTIA